MTDSDPTPRQEVIEFVAENVSEENPWVGMRKLFARARSGHYHNSRDDLVDAFKELRDEGKLVTWQYAATMNDSDLLSAWVREEAAGDGYTRKILIGKLNKIKAGAYDFSETEDPMDV